MKKAARETHCATAGSTAAQPDGPAEPYVGAKPGPAWLRLKGSRFWKGVVTHALWQ